MYWKFRLLTRVMDGCRRQEAFCHVPDLKKALVEAFRIFKEGRQIGPHRLDS